MLGLGLYACGNVHVVDKVKTDEKHTRRSDSDLYLV